MYRVLLYSPFYVTGTAVKKKKSRRLYLIQALFYNTSTTINILEFLTAVKLKGEINEETKGYCDRDCDDTCIVRSECSIL